MEHPMTVQVFLAGLSPWPPPTSCQSAGPRRRRSLSRRRMSADLSPWNCSSPQIWHCIFSPLQSHLKNKKYRNEADPVVILHNECFRNQITPPATNLVLSKKLAWRLESELEWSTFHDLRCCKLLCLVVRPPPITQPSQGAWHLAGLGPRLGGLWPAWDAVWCHNWGTPRCWGPSSTPPHGEVQDRYQNSVGSQTYQTMCFPSSLFCFWIRITLLPNTFPAYQKLPVAPRSQFAQHPWQDCRLSSFAWLLLLALRSTFSLGWKAKLGPFWPAFHGKRISMVLHMWKWHWDNIQMNTILAANVGTSSPCTASATDPEATSKSQKNFGFD